MMNATRPGLALALATGALLLAACDSPTSAPPGTPAPEAITDLPRELTTSEVEALSASNDFAFRLLSEVRAEREARENVFLSPLSVSMALGMAANGARDETLDAIRTTLGLEHLDREEMNEAYRGLLEILSSLDPQVDLSVANSAWMREGIAFRSTFVDRLQHYFDADARTLDFEDPASVDVVNQWISDRTNGRINAILQSISEDDLLFLVNAVHFDGAWRNRFDAAETRPRPFHLEGGETVDRTLMWQEEMEVRAAHTQDNILVADIPYGGGAYSMTIAMPQTKTLSELLDTMTGDRWDSWIDVLNTFPLPVALPRFEMDYDVRLAAPLSRMGMAIAFDPSDADFGDIHESSDLRIHIDRILHRTFLSVDEEGTEAAGATVIGFVPISGGDREPEPFIVDRPFLVVIRDRLSGAILFVGAVYDPGA